MHPPVMCFPPMISIMWVFVPFSVAVVRTSPGDQAVCEEYSGKRRRKVGTVRVVEFQIGKYHDTEVTASVADSATHS
jgi:hypothetical protein